VRNEHSLVKEIVHRFDEFISLVSCFLNILFGTGDREITLSAGSWQLVLEGKRRGFIFVAVIDGAWSLFGKKDHCYTYWLDHELLFQKVRNDHGGAP